MPSEHLRALIYELHPNVSVRQLETAAGLPEGKIGYYLKPSTQLKVIDPDVVKEIARALGCDLIEVVECFAADLGLPWGPDQSFAGSVKRLARILGVPPDVVEEIANNPALTQLIRDRRRLSAAEQETLFRMLLALAGGPATDVSSLYPEKPVGIDGVQSGRQYRQRSEDSQQYRPRGGAHVARDPGRQAH